MKKTLMAGAIAALAAFNASALTTGDLAFTAFNADEDGWSMVALADISAGTSVFFTDNEWNGTAFNTGESFHSWTIGASQINAGSVIRFSSIQSSTLLSATSGTLARETVSGSSNFGASASEETIYAYLGTATAPTTFLAAITSTAFGTASAGSLTNTGLSVGAGAIQLGGGAEFDQYTGARSGLTSFGAYKPLVSDIANWTNNPADGDYASMIPDTTAFTITPVPEPETYALLLAGLGLVGTIVRRRRAD